MKASELIKELQKQIEEHGDCDVYCEFDSGVRIKCVDVAYFDEIESNEHVDDNWAWSTLHDVFIINHEE